MLIITHINAQYCLMEGLFWKAVKMDLHLMQGFNRGPDIDSGGVDFDL